jgi:Protein of unknown function (DUF1403)
MQDYRTGKPGDGRGGCGASRWPKAPPRGTVPHARAPRFVRTLGSLHRLGGAVSGLGPREKPAGNRGRSRVSRRRLALRAAAASVARAGRSEDEAALRDALPLGRPGARRTNVLLPAFRMDAMRGFPRLRLRRLERVQHGDDGGFRSRRG